MGILSWIIVGGIAGWLASIVMKTDSRQGWIVDIVLGIVGAFVGGFVLNMLGIGAGMNGISIESILVAFIGAVIILAGLRLVRRG